MASNSLITSSLFPSITLSRKLKSQTLITHSHSPNPNSSIISNLTNPDTEHESKHNINALNLLQISVTLTIISASLPQPVLAAKVTQKKRAPKKLEALTPEEWKAWSQGLPVVANRIPYTDVIELKREGKLKHVIKPSGKGLREKPVVVLAVLEDNKVVRLVVPSVESDRKFWNEWDELEIDSVCVQAYTPPVKTPDVPKPVLGFLPKFPMWMYSLVKPKPVSKKVLELRRQREELKRSKVGEMVNVKKEMARRERAARAQKKIEERKKKIETQKLNSELAMEAARSRYIRMSDMWKELARDSNVTLGIGLLFFVIFYQTVVLSYKKQKKDYEDRLKIEKAEAEEKRKMKELERGMAGLDDDEDDEEGSGEENPYMKMAQQFMKSGARVRRAQNTKNTKLSQYLERGVDVKFTDVAGLGKIRLELEEIVKFFTHGEIYRRRGVKIPGGILLCGPPGVGKTLLAKAVAGEAGVNFFSISASQFVEIYVGVGASRVRALYQEARENAPSVVFIDELDAVGRERGLIKGSGGQERDATLNQLLVCLDGFEGRGNVITIASTNRPDILDPALVRPGRFDRKIFIPKPGFIGRIEILKVHARKKPMAEDVDYSVVAAMTDGMVGAELANIIEVAAINMMRDGRTEITTDDLLQAAQIEERGMLDKKDRSPEMWKQVAINEAAMAVVAMNFNDLSNIEFINIAPRAGRELGYVRMKMDHIKFREGLLSRQSLLDHITVQLAPRAADEIWHGAGQLSTIWAETADNARSAARALVLGGLSDKYYGVSNFWVADRINDIDSEALRILEMCYGRAKELLEKNRKLMDAVVDTLVEKKSLNKQEFRNLVELHGYIQPSPPSILDMRALKQAQMQSVMMKHDEANRVVT
ncbi:putative inactive ATP-dependent zinc metalloprotease FTSHI 2, chloroplastic [Bidens hawaiensis]|uniref:putative inactive ATP-dependent zinc metalloprotease FTSHI 2, chloroplastic n=1 Tax=Bidens hawaiensis TaxID=980011 RepID=UPI004049CC2D